MSKWTKSADSLPPVNQLVLGYNQITGRTPAVFDGSNWTIPYWERGGTTNSHFSQWHPAITHWQEWKLPEPPEDDK